MTPTVFWNTVEMVAPLAGARIEIVQIRILQLEELVAPLAGARIEISLTATDAALTLSLPSRERGLKFRFLVSVVVVWGRSPRGSAV